MSVSFRDLLSRPIESAKRPPAMPQGTYEGIVKSYEFGESREKKTPFVKFYFTVLAAGEDVDPTMLEGVDLTKRNPSVTFWQRLDGDLDWRLASFLTSLGLSGSASEAIPEAVGHAVQLYITQRPSQDGQDIFNDVKTVKGVA